MLFNGEEVGDGPARGGRGRRPARRDSADALGMLNSISVIAVAERGTMFFRGDCRLHGQDRGRAGGGRSDRHRRLADRERAPSRRSQGMRAEELTVVVLERDRHDGLIAELRDAGGASTSSATATWRRRSCGAGVDRRRHADGVGGKPEGVIAAAAIRAGRSPAGTLVWPRDDERARTCRPATTSPGCSTERDLVDSDNVFVAATGSRAAPSARRSYERACGRDQSLVSAFPLRHLRRNLVLHPSENSGDCERRALMPAHELRAIPTDRRRRQGDPRGGRADGDDRRASRLDRRRSRRGDGGAYRNLLFTTRPASRTTSAG